MGECQLMSIARALLTNRPIVLMDEATSNIDFYTDQKIQQIIAQKFKGKTVVTVAHRLNTVLSYDAILVLEKG